MMIPTPKFWYRQKSATDMLAKCALAPLGWLYGLIVRKRFDLYFPVPMTRPVICVGNLVAGGAGKTPVVLALADLMLEAGYNPHLLTRGYGGKEHGPLQVSPGRDTAYDVGDEALLLVEKAPTWVSFNRALGAQQAMDSGASIVVMDDGFQNPVIYKDFSFVVIDGAVGLGNRQVMPAGPLREKAKAGLERADAIVLIGEDKTGVTEFIRRYTQVPIIAAELVANEDNPDVKGQHIYAFAGIGRPQKFRDKLEEAGAVIDGWKEYPDHYPYDDEDMVEIISAAEGMNAMLVTTSKDYVRVPESVREKVQTFGVHLVWHDPAEVLPLIETALRKRPT